MFSSFVTTVVTPSEVLGAAVDAPSSVSVSGPSTRTWVLKPGGYMISAGGANRMSAPASAASAASRSSSRG